MTTATINEHGEKVTVIGEVAGPRGERCPITIVEYVSCGLPCFALKARSGGAADARRFSTQVKRAKAMYEHESNAAVWFV